MQAGDVHEGEGGVAEIACWLIYVAALKNATAVCGRSYGRWYAGALSCFKLCFADCRSAWIYQLAAACDWPAAVASPSQQCSSVSPSPTGGSALQCMQFGAHSTLCVKHSLSKL